MVPISALTCPADAANTAGTSSRPTFFAPGWRQFGTCTLSSPMRASTGSWNSNCAAPAASTPQAKA